MKITPEQLTAIWLETVGTKCGASHEEVMEFCESISNTSRLYEIKPTYGADTKEKAVAEVRAYLEALKVAESALLPYWAFAGEPARPGPNAFEAVERLTTTSDETILHIQLEIERRKFAAHTLLEALEKGPDRVYNESHFLNQAIAIRVEILEGWGATTRQARAMVEHVFIACKLPVPSSERAIRRKEMAASNPDWPVMVQACALAQKKLNTGLDKQLFDGLPEQLIEWYANTIHFKLQCMGESEGDSE